MKLKLRGSVCSDADYGSESSGSNPHLWRILSRNPAYSILTGGGGIELQSLSGVITTTTTTMAGFPSAILTLS